MIRISWMLVSYLAAAIVILAGPDQPEQAIDTERSSLTVHVGKAGLLSAVLKPGCVRRTEPMAPIDLISCLVSNELTLRADGCSNDAGNRPYFAMPTGLWITLTSPSIRK